MANESTPASAPSESRRQFLRSSTGAVVAGALASRLVVSQSVHAAGSDVLKIGLVGCGGRGGGAAQQALRADPNVKLTALADAFSDHLERRLGDLQKDEEIADKIDVPPERRFVGFNAYQQLIDSGVDVVLLGTPPHFRPMHLKAAVAAGKHVFAEKPVAVDGPGVRSVIETCRIAKEKGLSVVSGLNLRYSDALREATARLHDGAIGEILAVQADDYRGTLWVKKRKPEWTDMEHQMRNWYYYTWLSGDFNVEQHVHILDLASWAQNTAYPVRAVGTGGRQVRTGPEFGHIYDHFSITYEYENGSRLYATTRQMAGTEGGSGVVVFGSKGKAYLTHPLPGMKIAIESNEPGKTWSWHGKYNNPYQTEHDRLFASIRNGTPINNGVYMSNSTLLAIQGRMAAYTGKTIGWEQALNSQEDLSPPSYEWAVSLPEPPVAMPGLTKFV